MIDWKRIYVYLYMDFPLERQESSLRRGKKVEMEGP